MSGKKVVLVMDGDSGFQIQKKFENRFDPLLCETEEKLLQLLGSELPDLIVLDGAHRNVDSFAVLNSLKSNPEYSHVPVIMMAESISTDDRIKALEGGAEDYIDHDISNKELEARCDRVVMDHVANIQLKKQVELANEVAMKAMKGSSDLGENMQFFLDSVSCENLDELGMRMFATLRMYGLNCSLQMRSEFGVKNMEANGMAKELESQLLKELASHGRYVDFGKRSVMNYESISLLVKNMPVDDEERYGQVKDSVFSLLQAAHARMVALDNIKRLQLERDLMRLLTEKIQSSMTSIEKGFHQSMQAFSGIVEDMNDKVQEMISIMGLHEDQEVQLEAIISQAIELSNQEFSKGLRVDANFTTLIGHLNETLDPNKPPPTPKQLLVLINGLTE